MTPAREGKSVSTSGEESISPDGSEPTELEYSTLRRVGDKIPYSAYLVAIVELAERFTYYGLLGPFR